MKNLAHSASFHSGEKSAPSKPGTKHLVRDPAHLLIRARSLRLSTISFVRLTVSGRRLRCEAAVRPEMWPEAHVNERAHLRCSQVHQRGVTPAPLPGFGVGAGPERLHLLLKLHHDLAPEGLAEL